MNTETCPQPDVLESSSADQNQPAPAPPVAPGEVAEAARLDLEPAQRVAIVLLNSGRSKAEAATAAGVSRMTLYRWLKDDAEFRAAFNAWQNDVRSTAQAQLLAAAGDAVAVVVKSIRGGNAGLAWQMLTAQGVTRLSKPGSTDADHIRNRRSIARKRKQLAEQQQQRQLEQQEMTGGLF